MRGRVVAEARGPLAEAPATEAAATAPQSASNIAIATTQILYTLLNEFCIIFLTARLKLTHRP